MNIDDESKCLTDVTLADFETGFGYPILAVDVRITWRSKFRRYIFCFVDLLAEDAVHARLMGEQTYYNGDTKYTLSGDCKLLIEKPSRR